MDKRVKDLALLEHELGRLSVNKVNADEASFFPVPEKKQSCSEKAKREKSVARASKDILARASKTRDDIRQHSHSVVKRINEMVTSLSPVARNRLDELAQEFDSISSTKNEWNDDIYQDEDVLLSADAMGKRDLMLERGMEQNPLCLIAKIVTSCFLADTNAKIEDAVAYLSYDLEGSGIRDQTSENVIELFKLLFQVEDDETLSLSNENTHSSESNSVHPDDFLEPGETELADAAEGMLSDLPLKLFQRLRKNSRFVPFDTLRRDVWGKEGVSDRAIKRVVERLNTALGDTTFAVEQNSERAKLVGLHVSKLNHK